MQLTAEVHSLSGIYTSQQGSQRELTNAYMSQPKLIACLAAPKLEALQAAYATKQVYSLLGYTAHGKGCPPYSVYTTQHPSTNSHCNITHKVRNDLHKFLVLHMSQQESMPEQSWQQAIQKAQHADTSP